MAKPGHSPGPGSQAGKTLPTSGSVLPQPGLACVQRVPGCPSCARQSSPIQDWGLYRGWVRLPKAGDTRPTHILHSRVGQPAQAKEALGTVLVPGYLRASCGSRTLRGVSRAGPGPWGFPSPRPSTGAWEVVGQGHPNPQSQGMQQEAAGV